jgi:kynurenine formamidase
MAGLVMRRFLTPMIVGLIAVMQTLTDSPVAAQPVDALTLADLAAGRARVVDLGHSLNAKNPYWPGAGYHPFELKTIATLADDGVLSKTISLPEHLGTHIDAPNHFEAGQPAVDQLTFEQLNGPGVVIDVRSAVEVDHDHMLTLAEITDWEQRHGRIPDGAVVFLLTGWGRHFENYARYKNQDVRGQLHFPGYSEAAARFLVQQRKARGIGIDTLSIDRGLSKDFGVHHVVNGAGRYGLENVARLDQLPARGFHVFISPIKIETGSGGPTRITAILPAASSGSQADDDDSGSP